jgi:hypothetical protein
MWSISPTMLRTNKTDKSRKYVAIFKLWSTK